MTLAIDMTALRQSLDQLPRGQLLIIARRAAELMPEAALPLLLGGMIDLRQSPESGSGAPTLIEQVQCFSLESLSGKFHESFDVNSHNCSEHSQGTDAFNAEFDRLVSECIRCADARPCREVVEAFEILFSLLRYIDEGNDDVLFFGDAGGSWSVGVPWSEALPAYFLCLAQFASAEVYASCVSRVVSDFVDYDRDRDMTQAWHLATTEQRTWLPLSQGKT